MKPTTDQLLAAAVMNDEPLIRQIVTETMKRSPLSRAEIADRMTELSGDRVTERRLHRFSAESRQDAQFPAHLERAFCQVTGDTRLLTMRAEMAGFTVIAGEDLVALELGRAIMARTAANKKVAAANKKLKEIEKRIGVQL